MRAEAFRLELGRGEFHYKIEQETYKYMKENGVDFSFFYKQDMPLEYEREADIIDTHEFFLPWAYELVKKNKNVVVNMLESNIHSLKPWIEKNSKTFDRIKKKVKAFVGKTEWNRQLLEEIGVDKDKTFYIPYATDLDFFKPSVAKNWNVISGEDLSSQYIVMFMSSFSEGKGCVELVDQLHRTCMGRDITLMMSGGSVNDKAEEMFLNVKKYNLFKQIKVVPLSGVPFEALPAFINLADIFIIPQGGIEPMQFSQPMLWAMACGKPLLSLNRGCATSMIDNGVNGYKCNTYDEIGAWMSKLCSSEMDSERRNMGKESRAKAEREFSPEVTSKKYADLYRWVLDK